MSKVTNPALIRVLEFKLDSEYSSDTKLATKDTLSWFEAGDELARFDGLSNSDPFEKEDLRNFTKILQKLSLTNP